MPEIQLDHLSASSVDLYLQDGRAWWARYVAKIKSPPTPPLIVGSVFDRTVERYLAALVRGAQLNLLDLWSHAWKLYTQICPKCQKRGVTLDWQGELPEQLENIGAKLAGFKGTAQTLAKLLPLIGNAGEPALQRYIALHVPGVPVPTIGYIDLIERSGVPADIKTAASAWPEGKARRALQPRIYLAALLQAHVDVPRGSNGGYLFHHFIWTKTRETKIQMIETEFSLAEIFMACEQIARAWHGISQGVFAPNSEAWFCSEKFCVIWRDCMGRR